MELKREGLPEFANKVKDTYDYLTGKRTHSLSGLNDATDSEIKKCPELDQFMKSFKSAKGKANVQVDSSGKNFLVTFSATEVPKDLADQIKPGGKYYDMINRYDKESKSVEMIFTLNKKESVMAPTPTPYKLELKTESESSIGYDLVDRKSVTDSDGFVTDYSWYKSTDGMNVFVFGDSDFYGPADGDFDFETEDDREAQEWFDDYTGEEDISEDEMFESLIETAGLDTSVLVRKVNNEGQDSIEMDINGRVYSFTMKEDSPYTIDQMFHKVTKMRHYSEGRALAFLKKNMIGRRVESLTESKYAVQYYNGRLGKWITAQTYRDEESAKKDLPFHKKMCGAPGQGPIKDHEIKVVKLKESGNPFKSKHQCQGCGKPLSQCTCEVEDEESVEEALTEAVVPETYKSIKIELKDPDSQLENLIKCIKATSDPGHTFAVVVEPDTSDSKSFTMDGDGSFRITSIEVKDEVEDVEVKEESFYSPSTRKISIDDLKAFYNSSTSLKSEYDNFFAWYNAMVKAGKYSAEELNPGSVTQTGNVGQYKRGKIDMFPEVDEEEVNSSNGV